MIDGVKALNGGPVPANLPFYFDQVIQQGVLTPVYQAAPAVQLHIAKLPPLQRDVSG